MAKKDFKDAFLNMGEKANKNNENVKYSTQDTPTKKENKDVEKTPETIDVSNESEYTDLTSFVLHEVKKIEQQINDENNKMSFKKGKPKLKYSDKYRPATVSIRPSIRELLDELYNASNLNKSEILELVLINGLKNTNFND